MRTPQLTASVFAMLTFNAVAAEPQKLWEASGFKQPENRSSLTELRGLFMCRTSTAMR